LNNDTMKEIEHLVSEMHDDGLEGDDLQRLEELLTDDPCAQAHYWQLVDTHIALSVAVSSNSLEEPAAHDSLATDLLANRRGPPHLSRKPWLAVAAAAVLLVGVFWALNPKGESDLGDADSLPIAAGSRLLASEQIPTITQVSWEGPSFAANFTKWQPAAMSSTGAVTLRVQQGETADGYLFCLMPEESVKLVATFDATGENSLSVVEIGGRERVGLKKVSFHNAGAGPKPLHANPHVRNRRYGILGHWSETNATAEPRYFLLTGVHKLARPIPNETWRLSKIAVLVESDLVVHLGWDDSGPAPAEGQAYHEDNDYDDLTASLIFDRQASKQESAGRADIQVMTNQELSPPVAPSVPEGGYAFAIDPHSAAVLKAVSEATDLNGIVAIDEETNEVLWSSSRQAKESTNLGAACLFNPSDSVKRVRLVGIHKPRDSAGPGIPWRASAAETLYEQPGYFIIGFDDSRGDKDFNDVRINVLVAEVPGRSGS
jgi:hypothetical protein